MSIAKSIVGVWEVTTQGTPFSYHMFVFHADGSMLQFNPPAGNKETSDTPGVGVWKDLGKGNYKAKFVEFRVGFEDDVVSKGVVEFDLTLENDTLKGNCQFNVYDVKDGHLLHGPHPATLTGKRVTV